MANDILGQGWSFPPSFSRSSGSVALLSDAADVNSSLEILLSTTFGERVMQPTYGCNLKNYLFEPLEPSIKTYLEELIKTAILYHEPRISLNKIHLDIKQVEGQLLIQLDYTIKATNSRFNVVYPFYLQEGSNISS